MWPNGYLNPATEDAYVQKFEEASGVLSDASGAVYPIAVPRIDPGATSGNEYILPYSAQLFYAALSGIQTEYTVRGATPPTFHAYYNSDKTSYDEITSYSGLLSTPLENFYTVVEQAQNAISGLVYMSGWNDDMEDYLSRAFDYRVLMSGVPSGNRLQNDVAYYSVASGSMVTINPLDRARSGLFPINVEDSKHLNSQWGVASDGSRTYGTDEFGASGIAVDVQAERDPQFQQHAFMGHMDWLVQSIMWRPPIVESFTNGTEVAETGYISINSNDDAFRLGSSVVDETWNSHQAIVLGGSRGNTQMDLGSIAQSWPTRESPTANYYVFTSEYTQYVSAYDTYSPTDKGKTTPKALDMGEYGQVHIGKAKCRHSDTAHSALKNNVPKLQMISETTVSVTAGSGLDVSLSTNHYAYNNEQVPFPDAQEYWALGGTIVGSDPGLDEHLAESVISFVSPELSGRWVNHPEIDSMTDREPDWEAPTDGAYGTAFALTDRDPISSYPLGSGSAIVLDIEIDTHPTLASATGWSTSYVGESDPNGVFLSITTDRHVPTIFYNKTHNTADYTASPAATGRYLGATDSMAHHVWNGPAPRDADDAANLEDSGDWGFVRISFDGNPQHYPQYSVSSAITNPGFNTPYLELRHADSADVDGAFDPSGALVETSVVTYFETPTIVNAYRKAGGASKAYNSQVSWNGNWIPADSSYPSQPYADDADVSSTAQNAMPSGINFTQYKLDDYAPASGNKYCIPLWEKMKAEMDQTASVWGGMGASRGHPETGARDTIPQNWINSFRGANGIQGSATPSFGIEDDEDWFSIQAVTLNQVAMLDGSHLSDLGYVLKSYRYKFPVILGPSGIN